MRKIFVLALALSLSLISTAKEGMWLPQLIAQLNYDEMQRMGLQISAEDIYSVNQSSLKDAVVHFNGGCTAELISSKGLLLTNHHCGYSQIQKHSTLENNYLKDGFWAKSLAEEKPNPGLYAAIVDRLEDVSNQVLEGTTQSQSDAKRDSIIQVNIKSILAKEKELNPSLDYEVKDFFYGNQYILIVKKIFNDVRLVGAPPSSIGKYGADTDNWVWPRHTGDFSVFRVYANPENKPANYAEENVPYQPAQHLKVNIAGVEEGDFTMVYGFPGSTQQYLPATEVKNTVEVYNPARIAVRDKILSVLDAKMRINEATRLRYASKYARISNSWKRWKGEILGVARTHAIENLQAEEEAFVKACAGNPKLKGKENLVAELVDLYEQRMPLNMERFHYIEVGYFGIESFRYALGFGALIAAAEGDDEEALQKTAQQLANRYNAFMKDYEYELDLQVAKDILPMYLDAVSTNIPPNIAELKAADAESRAEEVTEFFEDAPFLHEGFDEAIVNNPKRMAKKIAKSDLYQLSKAMYEHYFQVIAAGLRDYEVEIKKKQAEYVAALPMAFPDKPFYPDANSTLRVAYGQVKGYEARDAVEYSYQTYLNGVMEKYIPGDYEFDLPQKLLELYEAKDFGPYADAQGRMPVCFVATNHTTGGNSGSPVLNSKGELIGLNFDRAWDGVMSDMYFDASICRNVMVDLRYVLFIIDKLGGAHYLVEEMDLVTERPQSSRTAAEKKEEEPMPKAG